MSAEPAVKYPYDFEVEINSSGVRTESKYGGHTVPWSSVRSIDLYNDKIEIQSYEMLIQIDSDECMTVDELRILWKEHKEL